MKKVWLFNNWCGGVMVQAVVYEALGGGAFDSQLGHARALLMCFQSGRNRLGKIFVSCYFQYVSLPFKTNFFVLKIPLMAKGLL